MKLSKIWIIQLVIFVLILLCALSGIHIINEYGLGIEPETLRMDISTVTSILEFMFYILLIIIILIIIDHVFKGSMFYEKEIISLDKFNMTSYNNDIVIIVFNNDLHVYPKWKRKYIIPRIKSGLPIIKYYTIKKKFLNYFLNI